MPLEDDDDALVKDLDLSVHPNGARGDATAATSRLLQEAQAMMEQQQRRPSAFVSHRSVQDVTANFIAASGQLKAGELVKDEYFTLFEAVGALEIMDPKMDSGFVEPTDTFEPEWKVIDEDGINGEEALWIMDELMRLEMLFHEGYPLSQNVFTSLHIFRLVDPGNTYPYNLALSEGNPSFTQRILRIYCLAVIKSCQLVLECIQAQTYYEEEDFVTYLFGRELCPNISIDEVTQSLSDIITEMLEDCKKDQSGFEIGLAVALIQRLEIRYHLLCSLERIPESAATVSYWTRLREQFNQATSNHALAKALPSAFSHKVQRQLASSTPPRPMPEMTWEEAQQKWIRLCDDILAGYNVTASDNVKSPHLLQSAIWSFSSRNPAPNTFARAKLQELITSDERVAEDVSHFDLMLADIRELVLPQDSLADPSSFMVEATHDMRHRTSRILEDFMIKAFGEYLNLYRVICQNRDRMRRLFTQSITLFDEMEVLALEADDEIMKITSPQNVSPEQSEAYYAIWTWTRMYKLRLVQWSIQLGFESDLYQDDGVYQMYDVLTSIFAQIEKSTRTSVLSAMAQAKSRRRHTSLVARENSIRWLSSLQQEAHAQQNLTVVLATFWEFLAKVDLLPLAEQRPYHNEQRQYEARMKPFIRVQYQVIPSLDDLRKCKTDRAAHPYNPTELQSHLEAMMGFSRNASHQRTILEELKQVRDATPKEDSFRLQELKNLEATCWAIKIALGQLVGICKKIGKEHESSPRLSLKGVVAVTLPEAQERKHVWWVVPKIIEVTVP
ncbi:hypothetical protein CKM354_000055000 [Cercospora kikuchii]|uniref:Uncharacterized protein n=1 Tax=Cercospora kikuchii TaxID=84275 RepID=A0A9P3C961_9PEZI|nr:uncharacterized protein CKM354_000055000 [Cercospora kikuchii]GIZ37087.1 hypothetical protein CKM354_000055000 [Cercospora kikuchii]